ncbi:MAG: hypothetical protein EOP47_25290 [Sphingobacteriaceae bacterium]|nr:MAG: hypothetical protein EOP47_25290 [Sphingobacteriaceae bacterium]
MKKIIIILCLCCVVTQLLAQKHDLKKIAKAIQDEGETLYRYEWASWYGSDIFLEKYSNKRDRIAGYLSYDSGKGLVNIFIAKGANPKTLATITFEYGFNRHKYVLDTTSRLLTKAEKELYTIRQTAIEAIKTDTTFKHFNNARLNPVPLIYKGVKKVYVLTGPNLSDVVLFGNDYQINFDKSDQIVSTQKLHNSLIPIEYSKKSADSIKTDLVSIHNHVKGKSEFITVTDVCTIMLYEKFTAWKQCIVMSENYISIWDCEKNNLKIVTREEWEKMYPVKNNLIPSAH